MNCIEALTSRRGVLRYHPFPVERGLIDQVLKAAVAAPSPVNLQPWAFVVVTDPEHTVKIARYLMDVQKRRVFQDFLGLSSEEAERYMNLYEHFENAPCFIIVCCEPKAEFALPEHQPVLRDWYLMCLGAAVSNLMAAATACGLATRWFSGFALDSGRQYMKDLLSIPGEVEIVAVTPLGYAADKSPIRARRRLARQELAAFRRSDQPALAGVLRGKLPLESVVHHSSWFEEV